MTNGGLRPQHVLQNSQTALAEGKIHLTAHQAESRERGPHVANLNEFVCCLLKPGYCGVLIWGPHSPQ